MKRWMARQLFPDDLGFAPAMIAVVIAGALQAVFTGAHLMFFLGAGNEPVVRLNLWLLAVLAASYVLWLLVALRRPLRFATGAGFLLSAYGLAGRATTEYLRANLGPTWREFDDGTGVVNAVEWTRTAGLVAFATGLMLVASASVVEARLAHSRPVPRLRGGQRPQRDGVFHVFR